ncbi:MAG: ATP-binding protein [Draconibacterium sp.]
MEAYKKSENGNVAYALYDIGRVYTHRGDYAKAINYQKEAFELALSLNRKKEMSQAMLGLGDAYRQKGDSKEAISSFLKAREIAKEIGGNYELKDAYEALANLYSRTSDYRRAYQYQTMYSEIKDTLYDAAMDKRIQSMSLKFDLEKKQGEIDLLEKDKIQKIQQSKNQRLWIFSISGALLSALLLSFVLYRNNKNKQRSNAMLKEQKEEIQKTLEKLKDTQSQLIHAEKMASLGELTAGIAHEIQNPLNFVNNFSEVSNEMMEEMMEELEKGDLDEAKEIATDIRQNLQKINTHGKRADSIVRGMLQHSRMSSGLKEPTAINDLANEYLRLSYHGLRAKDDGFNASLKTDFDDSIGKIKIVPQEISRVLLNIFTNAFYALNEKKKQNLKDYKPEVSVSTRKIGNKVEIKIVDNANGIPKDVLSKIFQPFFTTKPTGEGTGLGLSLSYDIITKGHGGELNVDTKVGEGTVFTIILPV